LRAPSTTIDAVELLASVVFLRQKLIIAPHRS
jgi:hypothetical protein